MWASACQDTLKGERFVLSDLPVVVQSVAELGVQPGLPEVSVQSSVPTRAFLFPFQQLSVPSAGAAIIVVLSCLKHCCDFLIALPVHPVPLSGALQLCSHEQSLVKLQSRLCLSPGIWI